MPERKITEDYSLVALTEGEKHVLVHALREELDRVDRAGGDWYGSMSLLEARRLVEYLR